MEGNDIGVGWDWRRRVGAMFEHVIASKPAVNKRKDAPLYTRMQSWWKRTEETPDEWLGRWKINPIPLRSLRRIESHGVPVEVYTFLEEENVEYIDKQLRQWGLQSVHVMAFFDVDDLVDYIGSTLEIVHCWVPEDVALWIGPGRATVADTTTELSIG